MTPVDDPPRQEPEVLSQRRLVAVAAVASLIGIGAVWWSWLILRSGARPPPTAGVAPASVGLVDQTLIEREDRARLLRDDQRARLDSYGWVDRAHGIVRIPIDDAMALSAEAERR